MQREHLIALAYIFVRLAPITLIAPLFFLTYVPLLVRTFLTLTVGFVIAFSMDQPQLKMIGMQANIAVLANEFILGMVLSLGFHAVSAGLHMMAQLIDIQMGISTGATFNPISYQTDSPTGKLFSMIAVAIFFGTGLHYEFIYMLGELFRILPPGEEITLTKSYFLAVSKLFAASFILAGPVIIVLFLTDVTLALISRSMPQAQIYFVALPLKVMIGLLMLALTLSISQMFFYELLVGALSTWNHIMLK